MHKFLVLPFIIITLEHDHDRILCLAQKSTLPVVKEYSEKENTNNCVKPLGLVKGALIGPEGPHITFTMLHRQVEKPA